MKIIYKIPGYILCLLGGFFLSWGGLIIRSFETNDIWQILLIRSFFFMIALIIFLVLTYKKDTIVVIKKSGLPAVVAGLFLSLSFVAYIIAMSKTSVANVVFIISTQTIFLAIFGYLFLREKINFKGFVAITLALVGIVVMIGDSIYQGTLFGNIVAFAIPINFTILVMIIRKFPKLDMVPAIFYSGIFSGLYGLFLSNNMYFSANDLLMGFLLGVPQLAFGFICVTIGTKTTPAVTVGLLMLLETIFAPIWVWIFLSEVPPISVFVGGSIIISAVILKSFDKSKKIIN
jgi:drug/metabolite transporter (DMT)-like permease